MRYPMHYFEEPPKRLRRLIKDRFGSSAHKVAVWNSFVDSELSGINEDDCDIVPRILPGNYLPTIRQAAHTITLFAMRLLSLPEREVKAILPHTPIRDFLIDELKVLKFRSGRMTGSFRFDMAIVGPPQKNNPPKLLEINEIGFDGLARSSHIQETLLSLLPQLRTKVFALDTAGAEARNMRRLGHRGSRFQYGHYNWEEEVLVNRAGRLGLQIDLISPNCYRCPPDEDLTLLRFEEVKIHKGQMIVGKNERPDFFQMGFSFELKDYLEAVPFYRSLVQSKTPQYGPFLTGLVASKMILVLLNDPALQRRLLGNSKKLSSVLLPALKLADSQESVSVKYPKWVLKHVDGLGGELVFIGNELATQLKKIRPKDYFQWILQQRTKLNIIDVHGILSRPRRVIADLGVFVQYDWRKDRFLHFEVGGFITRATNRSYKVNVSGGGIQVPVMFDRS